MTQSILLISPLEDTFDLLRLTCQQCPVRVIHATEGHTGAIVARASRPLMIFIDAVGTFSYNGWVMARLIKMDRQLRDIPVVMFSNAHDAEKLAHKSEVYCQLPRAFPIAYTRALIQQYVEVFTD